MRSVARFTATSHSTTTVTVCLPERMGRRSIDSTGAAMNPGLPSSAVNTLMSIATDELGSAQLASAR